MATWPIIGRSVRIGIAMIRLPDIKHRQFVFESEQLPSLLNTISDINHRQLATDNDSENLARSVPVALRKITKQMTLMRDQLHSHNNYMRDINEIHAQLENSSSSINYLLGRVEFVRRELMFEMRYGAGSHISEAGQLKTEIEIINHAKLAAAKRDGILLNIGCGHVIMNDYINVDRRKLPGVDIVAEANDLPFEYNEITEIYTAHMLEHFPQEQLRRELLPYYLNLLKPGCLFRAITPDAKAMILEYVSGAYPYNDMREVMYGAQDYNGDFHYNMFTPDHLAALLLEAGFCNISVEAEGRRNGKCYEMEISAYKPI